ncbi:MAG: hypothetical protein LC720_06840 [Actinobacteria bacterium]|nr:hypothetical protein [Actinomycetota bacterium]
MNREDADEAFDCLARHARATPAPGGPEQALALVDKASLAELQRTAIVHYISNGPAVVNLAYRVLKAGTATLVAARFAADQDPEGGLVDPAPQRELFAERLIELTAGLDPATPADRAAGLIDALSGRVARGRALLEAGGPRPAGAVRAGVGDLLEAAGIAYVLAQLLENPPQPAVAAAG